MVRSRRTQRVLAFAAAPSWGGLADGSGRALSSTEPGVTLHALPRRRTRYAARRSEPLASHLRATTCAATAVTLDLSSKGS
jgi:hypothetical protein